jgi:hypothetical protein
MNRISTVLVGFVICALTQFSHVSAATIDFEGVVGPGQYLDLPVFAPYIEDNFALSQAGYQAGFFGSGFFQNESSVVGWCTLFCDGGPNSISLEHEGHSLFNLERLEAGDLSTAGFLLVEGYLAGGGLLSASIAVDALSTSAYQFSPDWVNLQSVTFSALDSNVWIDNIAVTAVPVPAAAWLFGSALAAIGFARRRINAL